MSGLTLGGPEGLRWSNPSPVYVGGQYRSDGMLFIGYGPVTINDLKELDEYMNGKSYGIDQRTLVGRWAENWTTYGDVLSQTKPEHMMGGKGSTPYMMQKVGAGVSFTDEPIWHTDINGYFVKAVPQAFGEGAYHTIFTDGYGDNFEGPMPGSQAEELLQGNYHFDPVDGVYFSR